MQLTAERLGWDAFRPGDVFYMNDSYMTGTHLNDATIFGADLLAATGWSASRPPRAHWLDVGAKDPGGADGLDARSTRRGCAGARRGSSTRGEPREDIIDLLAPQRPLRLLAGRRHERAGGGVPDGRARASRRSSTASATRPYAAAREEIYRQSRGARAGGGGGDPRRHVHARRAALDDDGLGHGPVPVHVRVDVRGRPDDDRPRGLVPADRGPGQLRPRAGRVGLPCRLQAADQPASARSTAARSRRWTSTMPARSIFSAEEPAACQWYFTPLRPPDRPDRQGALAGDARARRCRALRRLDGRCTSRGTIRAATAQRFLDVRAAPGRLGRLRGRRRRRRADQQRQRRRSRTTRSRSPRASGRS